MKKAARSGGLTVQDTLTDRETDVFIEIMRTGGFSTPAAVLRCALWRLAVHYDIPCEPELFSRGREV